MDLHWLARTIPGGADNIGDLIGPMLEENLRRALLISEGDPLVFLRRPISLAINLATILILITMAAPAVRKRRGDITG